MEAKNLSKIYLKPEVKKDLYTRLSRIEGHVRAIRRMLDQEEDCDAILIQMAAVKSALNRAIVKLLEGHMESCVMGCNTPEESMEALERLKQALTLVLKNS